MKKIIRKMKGCPVFLLSILLFFSLSCKQNKENTLNYAQKNNWVSLPSVVKPIDVFYLYPTVSENKSGTMDITHHKERSLALGIFKAQASVFKNEANIFAPFYRQMSTACVSGDNPTEIDEFLFGLKDVIAAFDYYLKYLNKNRPFIIAGHSQGSMAALEMIKKIYGQDKSFHKRLIAAYIIGWTVTDDDLKQANLQIAEKANDVGCVITFNTVERDSAGGPMLLAGAHCINPLNWRTDVVLAKKIKNLGACFYDNDTGQFKYEIKNFCCAQVDVKSGALYTNISPQDIATLDLGPYEGTGIYHRYDYAFWYRNLQENAHERIEAYFTQLKIQKFLFDKNLSWNQFQFKVEATADFLKITPIGLEIQKDAVKHAIKGFKVIGADIGDLNLDSSPEVFVYLEAINDPSERKLIGYSVNNGKSMSQVALPSILKNKKVNKGYKGYDEMAIVESTFCQRFPIYTEKPTPHRSGKTRQIQYKLVNGEACRILKIDRVIEY